MKIDNVYIITLDMSPEYQQNLIDRLSELKLPAGTNVEIKQGFLGTRLRSGEKGLPYRLYDGWDLSENGNDNFWWIRPVTDGEAGGCISHTQCWEDAYQNGYETIMIIEDDFIPFGPIDWTIFEELGDYYWDICLMSHNSLDHLYSDVAKPATINLQNFIRPTYFYNTHTYLLQRPGIRKLVEDHLPVLKDNVIVSDEFLSAVITGHPRWDLRKMFIPNMIAIATKKDFTGQYRSEGLGNSLTEPDAL